MWNNAQRPLLELYSLKGFVEIQIILINLKQCQVVNVKSDAQSNLSGTINKMSLFICAIYGCCILQSICFNVDFMSLAINGNLLLSDRNHLLACESI